MSHPMARRTYRPPQQLHVGPPRFVLTRTEVTTSTGHQFCNHAAIFCPASRILEDKLATKYVPRGLSKQAAMQLFDEFFGGPTRILQVYKLV
eukprot:COSAG05_NODE_7_length_42457_cov_58.929152_37_plen_92_part_00